MSGSVPVLVNRNGGTAASKGNALKAEIEAAFADAGVEIALQLLDGKDMRAAVIAAADQPIVVVGGGDGTLGCAASELYSRAAALGILPLGTRNHLARELNIPLDLQGAAKLIAQRATRKIDLARVNDHIFVNNASIGYYPAMVRERDHLEAPKWLTVIPAGIAALRRLRHHRLKLRMPGTARDIATPMLFVGNNRYMLSGGQIGTRDALDGGRLSVYAVASRRRLALIGFAIRTMFGRADREHDFATIGDTGTLEVSGRSRKVDIALDGEVMELEMPLRFECLAGALTVVASPA